MGFVGVITIISGVISVLFSLASFALGAVPGIISIILGAKLCTAKHYVNDIIATPLGVDYTPQFNLFAANLNSFFKIQGLLVLIIMLFLLFAGFLTVLLGMAFFSRFN